MNQEFPNLQTPFILLLCLFTFSILACSPDCDEDNYCYLNNCHSCQPYRAYWDKEIPEWGEQVGEVDGIPAYSNKNDAQVLDKSKDDYLTQNQTGYNESIYIGQKYQCVHFARHYWILNYGAAFESIDTANQIFYLSNAKDYNTDGYRKLISISNGSKDIPQLGDLLIWELSFPYFPAGHVAVIVGIDFASSIPHVLIAEQNYDNGWDAKTYARALKVDIDMDGGITILNQRIVIPGKEIIKCRDYKGSLEEIILGWVRLE